MPRTLTIYPPRSQPKAAPTADEGGGTVSFGPIGWEWASQGDDGDEAAIFAPPLELVHIRNNDFAVATCPGAVSWRIDPEPGTPPDYKFYPLANGACVIQALNDSATADFYATSSTGEELGPITVESVV